MIGQLLAKVIGTQNEREIKRLRPRVVEINALEPAIQALTDEQLRAKTVEFRERVAGGETLNDLLPEAFAVVREAGRRVLNMRHFDVQLIGGMVLHNGTIAEMKTGEGKTLVATLPAYLNALEGKGVHVVTVNDYLARRDSEWMGRLYRFLGMSVGVIQHDLKDDQRQVAYGADITYGTNNEFGFDYLRDNMKFELSHMVQRGHHFAIVDEVDSILIDEARTPLIISGPAEESTDLYYEVDRIIPRLKKGAVTQGNVKAEDREQLETTGDYIVDEKHKTVTLTETGMAKSEDMLSHRLVPDSNGLYDPANMPLLHHVNQALRAHTLFRLDVEYMIKDGQVVIVDEFTGRLMPGRRWSDGLHQAVEAKEKVKIERENQTLATITFQNYFRKYKKLSGMTGTAETEASEFAKIYNLDVIVVPTNRVLRRVEEPDLIYRTEREKYEAIVSDIIEKQGSGRPTLVGTVSIEKSERLSSLLKKRGIKHVVLNAKYHAQEAEIVAQAGHKNNVTIATNMAGRGTDILLGGNPEYAARHQCLAEEVAERLAKGEEKFIDDEEFVYFFHVDGFYRVPRPDWERIAAHFKQQMDAEHEEVVNIGGLHILGTERHEARRIDNQLRGRAGRQGDPGSSRFYLSLEDDLMRIFGSDRMDGMLQKLGLQDGEAITHPWINKALEKAQQKVEARNFDSRKYVLKYDDVMNDQRKVIFEHRIDIMGHDDVSETVKELRHEVVTGLVSQHIPENAYAEQWNTDDLKSEVQRIFALDLPIDKWAAEEGIADQEITERLTKEIDAKARAKEAEFGSETMRQIEKMVLLQTLDHLWREHLVTLEHLRQVIGFRSYGQRDPLNEYKSEGFHLFETMLANLREAVTGQLMHIQGMPEEEPEMQEVALPPMRASHVDPFTGEDELAMADAALAGRPSNGQAERRAPLQTRKAAGAALNPNDPATWGKVARNAPCPCGSGKKYKHCHGRHD